MLSDFTAKILFVSVSTTPSCLGLKQDLGIGTNSSSRNEICCTSAPSIAENNCLCEVIECLGYLISLTSLAITCESALARFFWCESSAITKEECCFPSTPFLLLPMPNNCCQRNPSILKRGARRGCGPGGGGRGGARRRHSHGDRRSKAELSLQRLSTRLALATLTQADSLNFTRTQADSDFRAVTVTSHGDSGS